MQFLVRLYTYFRRGWGLVGFLISFVNFDLISYRLLIEQVSFLKALFPSLWVYTVVLLLLGVPALIVLGYLDLKHGTAPFEVSRTSEHSPWHRSLMRALYHLANNEPDKARDELMRWI